MKAEQDFKSLSLILPAYNEAGNIERSTRQAFMTAESLFNEFEVIIVNDGSTDGTRERIEALREELGPRLVAIHKPVNQGYGAALRSGMSAARGDLIFYTDADNQFDMGELRDFLPLIRNHDVVLGFRINRQEGWLRRFLAWGYNRLISLLFHTNFRDIDCSFKLFRREVIERITIEWDNFFVDTELIVKARQENFRILEKGVRHLPRTWGKSTVTINAIPRTLKPVLRLWWRINIKGRTKV